MLIDTHCHLFKEYFSDIDFIINNAKKNKVGLFISASDNIESCKEMITLSKEFKDIYFCLGIHPSCLNENIEELENLVKSNLDNDKFVAIGEIGLDYYYGKDNKEKQIELFEYQLNLAEKYKLPVVIHSREATNDTINILKKYKVTGVIHSFNGSLETAKEYIKMGFKLGVNGIITFKNCKLKEVIKELDLSNIVLETDAPYLTPEPFRKYSNESKYILTIAEFLSNLMDVSLEDIVKNTTNNAYDIFDINISL